MKLSVVVPAFNEEKRIRELVTQLAASLEPLGSDAEIVVVDDGSQDNTRSEVPEGVARLLIHEKNKGKAAAVQTGIAQSKGDFIAVLDADLEYFPADLIKLLVATNGQREIAVYGSRYLEPANFRTGVLGKLRVLKDQEITSWIANWTLSFLVALLYRHWITDTLTGLKLYPGEFLRNQKLVTTGFEGDHEITARLIRKGIAVAECPIGYAPRDRSEGKKIGPRDGVIAVLTFLRFRFI